MTITIQPGITIGQGISIGKIPLPNSRLVGAAGTNVSQTYVRTGTPTTSTAIAPVIGTSSGNFSQAGAQYIRTTSPTPTMTNFGTGNFTIEGWIYLPTIPSSARELIATEVTNGFGLRLGRAFGGPINFISLFARTGPDQNFFPYTWQAATWTYIAVQRSGANLSFWAGTQGNATANYIASTGFTTSTAVGYNYPNATAGGVTIAGFPGTTNSSQTFINTLVISNIARYPEFNRPISIPTTFFTVDQFTTQLLTFQGPNGGTTFTNETG
jgi:hypothetical protein